jgi:Rha family phage regulatory protein
MPNETLKPAIQIIDGHATTTSLRIAEHFGKKHFHVLRAIKNLDCSPEFRASNFGLTSKPVQMPGGGVRNDTVCTMTRDGFVFLAMGFTGKEAARWKEAYINAFNEMESEIARQQQAATLPIISRPDPDTINRINQRAWNLAQASFEGYRSRMMDDVLIMNGSTKPEDWEPVETSTEMIEMITATVNGLESMTRSLRRKVTRLEAAANHGKVAPQGASGLRKKLNKHPK